MACATINDHSVSLLDLEDEVVDDSYSPLVSNTALEHSECLLIHNGQALNQCHIVSVSLNILQSDSRA